MRMFLGSAEQKAAQLARNAELRAAVHGMRPGDIIEATEQEIEEMSTDRGNQRPIRRDWATSEFDGRRSPMEGPGMDQKIPTSGLSPLTECVQVACELNSKLKDEVEYLNEIVLRVAGNFLVAESPARDRDMAHLQPEGSTIGDLQRALVSIDERIVELGLGLCVLATKM